MMYMDEGDFLEYDIQMVKGVRSALFGGEGLFYAVLTGPGTVWIQSLPFNRLAARVVQSMPSQGEESSLGGSIGNFLSGR